MYVLGMLRADPFVYDNEWGLRTRRKGWPGDASAELGPGADPGVSDGRKLFVALVVREPANDNPAEAQSDPRPSPTLPQASGSGGRRLPGGKCSLLN